MRDVAPTITDATDWQSALDNVREREKQLTRQLDALAATRRRLPMTKIAGHYSFNTEQGRCSLLDLFNSQRQLICYHHMLKPQDASPCSGCCMVVDNIGNLAPLRARNTEFIVTALAPYNELAALKARLGWQVPCASAEDRFHSDMGITDGFGLSVFLRNGDDVYRSYFTTGRGVESLGSVWSLLDLTPYGRQEHWEDSPQGWPQTPAYAWWRLHDEY